MPPPEPPVPPAPPEPPAPPAPAVPPAPPEPPLEPQPVSTQPITKIAALFFMSLVLRSRGRVVHPLCHAKPFEITSGVAQLPQNCLHLRQARETFEDRTIFGQKTTSRAPTRRSKKFSKLVTSRPICRPARDRATARAARSTRAPRASRPARRSLPG